jgi:hypothetical protein
MSAIRTIAVVAVLLAVAASAASTFQVGCGVMPKVSLFGNSSLKCSKGDECLAAYCKCISAPVGNNFTCGASTKAPNCTVATACIASRTACINKAADDATCVSLKDLKMSNLAVAGGQLYSASAAFASCKYDTCIALNTTAGNCTLDFNALCASPVVFIGTLRLKGDFSKLLSDPVASKAFVAALEADLAKSLGVAHVVIIRIYISAKSRRQAQQTLIIEFSVPGVSAQNAAFASALAAVASGNGSWLVAALAAYKAVYGASASFTFAGIAAGSASTAFSKVVSKAGSKPKPVSKPGSKPTGSSDDSSASGAASQSVVAAVVVAVIGAMLF